MDRQTAAVEQLVRFALRISLLRHQIVDDLFGQGIHKVGGTGTALHLDIYCLNAVVDVVVYGLVILILIDISLIQHFVQHSLPTGSIFLRMADGIVTGGILGNGSDDSALRQCQIGNILIKIALGSCLDAQGVLAEVDGVEVILQNLLFAGYLFQLNGQVLFLDLAVDTVQHGFLAGPGGKVVVFQKLLRDGAGALGFPKAGHDGGDTRPDHAPDIHTVVGVETLILDGHNGVLQIYRNLVQRHILPVGTGGSQSLDLVAVGVQHGGQISFGGDVHRGDIRTLLDQTCHIDGGRNGCDRNDNQYTYKQ